MAQLNCVVVTPEETALEQTASFIVLPLFDGEIGIGPGHSPLIGRLGFGEGAGALSWHAGTSLADQAQKQIIALLNKDFGKIVLTVLIIFKDNDDVFNIFSCFFSSFLVFR